MKPAAKKSRNSGIIRAVNLATFAARDPLAEARAIVAACIIAEIFGRG